MSIEIVKINKVDVVCPLDKGEQYVAIKPICEILGVSHQGQFKRIQADEILSSVVNQWLTTGADSKKYDMTCLPLRYVFGWLFSIDTEKVKPEAKEQVIKYKRICYDVLYDHFMGPISERKRDLSRKSEIARRIVELDDQLKENKEYNELINLKAEEMRLGKSLKENDKQIMGGQLTLFSEDNG